MNALTAARDEVSLWRRLLLTLEEGGPPRLLRHALTFLAAPMAEFGSVRFFRRLLAEGPEGSRRALPLTVRSASLSDLALVLEASDPRRTPELVTERLRRGDQCFLAFDPLGRPVHSDWATTVRARIPELEHDIVPREGEAYLYDAFTPSCQRGHGAFGFVLDHMFVELRAQGIRVAYSYVRGDEPEGQRSACRRLRPVGRLFYLRVRGCRPLVFGPREGALPALAQRGPEKAGAELNAQTQPSSI